MKIVYYTGLALAVGVSFCALEARAQNLILNSGFELGPAGTPFDSPPGGGSGNNIGVVPASWTVAPGLSNLQQGTAAGDGGVTLAPFNGIYSGLANGAGGNHFFDGVSNPTSSPVTISQSFSIASVTALSGTFALGIRDADPSRLGQTSVLTIASTAPGSSFTPFTFTTSPTTQAAGGTWTVNTFSLAAVPAGSYTLSFSLADSQNIDAVALVSSPIPEPSTWAMAIGGLGVMLLLRRRSRRVA